MGRVATKCKSTLNRFGIPPANAVARENKCGFYLTEYVIPSLGGCFGYTKSSKKILDNNLSNRCVKKATDINKVPDGSVIKFLKDKKRNYNHYAMVYTDDNGEKRLHENLTVYRNNTWYLSNTRTFEKGRDGRTWLWFTPIYPKELQKQVPVAIENLIGEISTKTKQELYKLPEINYKPPSPPLIVGPIDKNRSSIPIELKIQSKSTDKVTLPYVLNDMILEQEIKGSPSKLTFKILYYEKFLPDLGDKISLDYYNDTHMLNSNLFMGYIFNIKTSEKNIIEITAYDQLRYFKNKESMVYENISVSKLVNSICGKFNLQAGVIEESGCIIPYRIEKDKTMFDIIQTAIDITNICTGRLFVLYDYNGMVWLKEKHPVTHYLLSSSIAQSFEFTASIDESYNQIVLYKDDDKTHERVNYAPVKDVETIKKWGVLQYYTEASEAWSNPVEQANMLLKLHNKPKKSFTIKGAKGHPDIRPGVLIPVKLSFDKSNEDEGKVFFMLVEKIKHSFKGEHLVDLTLRGNEDG